jgi:sigma-B regulation protein RsbU (phosphoserine phosphatase)
VRIYDDEIGIVIADVSGKGVPAAILMAFLRSSLRAATHIGYATNISLSKVNYLLWESIERNQFVTAFHAILDASNRTLSYSNAGHNPPLLINAKGEASVIEYGEQPLGMFPDTRYHQYHLLLEPGDVLVLYTDGVTEASNPDGVEFGRDRLVQAVKDNYDRPARELIASMEMAVLEWTGNRGANDDVTFFVIKALK